jgi:hypothetical protein
MNQQYRNNPVYSAEVSEQINRFRRQQSGAPLLVVFLLIGIGAMVFMGLFGGLGYILKSLS